MLPSLVTEFESVIGLMNEIRTFIHRYCDLTNEFEQIATSYILLSWVYEGFNELPYLRFRGDPGSGKTRSLLVIGFSLL